mgnify:CR=1 FL=1
MTRKYPVVSNGLVTVTNFTRRHLTSNYISWLNDQELVKYSEQRHLNHTF